MSVFIGAWDFKKVGVSVDDLSCLVAGRDAFDDFAGLHVDHIQGAVG